MQQVTTLFQPAKPSQYIKLHIFCQYITILRHAKKHEKNLLAKGDIQIRITPNLINGLDETIQNCNLTNNF